MPPSANISINAVDGSNDDLPINTLVALNNQNTGGELTFAWTILDQPPGIADALSSTVIQNPTFTPRKEGTYLIRLVVNAATATEVADQVIVGIRNTKTRERKPAAGETTENSLSQGWSPTANRWLQRVDDLLGPTFGLIVGVAATPLMRGDVVLLLNQSTINTGLPGEQQAPVLAKALATAFDNHRGILGIIEGAPNGNPAVVGGAPAVARVSGLFGPVVIAAAVPATSPLYVSNAALVDSVPGTTTRVIGRVLSQVGVLHYLWINSEIDPKNGFAEFFDVRQELDVHGTGMLLSQAAATQSIVQTVGIGLFLGTIDPAAFLRFVAGGLNRWEIDSVTGALKGLGGDKPIQAVLDPVAAQDAATKAYVDAQIVASSGSLKQTKFAEVTVDTTTVSLVFVDLLTVNITLTSAILLIWASFSASNSSNGNKVIFRITVDGVAHRGGQATSTGANSGEAGAIIERVPGLALGAHTIKVQWRVNGTTGQIRPVAAADTEHASLMVAEVNV